MTDNQDKRPADTLDYEPVAQFQTEPKPATEPAGQENGAEPLVKLKTSNAAVNSTIATVNKTAQRPMVAHLLRATERFNDRLGNQFGAAITYFSFLSLIPIMMVAFAAGAISSPRIPPCCRTSSIKFSPTSANPRLPPR